ncbi:Pumilio RNA-binding repeat [Heracleum sosnowskyi]|uniref:Pumilio RNA-binding repeat n=1 Tax=Heracleum sosnowskyi TaxID=360622 RepID=A0AAD8I0L5_9APIA|nr:Pumilio RNA-binding repeat [Heracleum sosnowskyi]
MAGEYSTHNHGGKKRGMNKKGNKKGGGDYSSQMNYDGGYDDTFNSKKFSRHQQDFEPQTSFVSKQVDPEVSKYFSEISNVIEGTEIDYEERAGICGNALEEARGKEVELATDYILSHTLQSLLEGCSLDHLCSFLHGCSKDFPRIAMDKSGSHVAESALKALAMHLQDTENYSLLEDTVTSICQAIVLNPVDVMCDCYGSHVLRSLLCLCKGVPIDSAESHGKKSSVVLAERLNLKPSHLDRNVLQQHSQGFPNLLTYLVKEMLNAAREDIKTLQVDQYSSLVLQTALKMLNGNEEELLHVIPILLGCSMENIQEGKLIKDNAVHNLLSLMKESAFSHLMEVILEVAPETVYNELLAKVFKNSIFDLSSHHCGNFVVQSLISHAKCHNHMDLIWEELGTKFKDLFEVGRSGVVASIIATGQRLNSHETKCCQALAASVSLANESARYIVPRILFLDNYFFCRDKSNWNWPNDAKMHVMGTLILQIVFKFPSEFIQAYISSITSLETDHVLHALKDFGGARVIEAFLCSNASGKQKRKLVVRLRGHFKDLSLHPSGAFTVEKCFSVSNMSMRELIVSELLDVQSELSKTKQGPHLLRILDVDGYAKRPEQWKSRQATKETAYKEFYATFGPNTSLKKNSFLSNTHRSSQPEKVKEIRKEIDNHVATLLDPSLKTAGKHTPEVDANPARDNKAKNKKRKSIDKGGSDNVIASKTIDVHSEKSSKSDEKKLKKRHKEESTSKSSRKKIKS